MIGAAAPCPRGGIETGDETLRGSLLVAGGAIDLAGEIQPGSRLVSSVGLSSRGST